MDKNFKIDGMIYENQPHSYNVENTEQGQNMMDVKSPKEEESCGPMSPKTSKRGEKIIWSKSEDEQIVSFQLPSQLYFSSQSTRRHLN